MKIVSLLLFVFYTSFGFSQGKLMFDITAGKEVDMNTTYYPYTFSSILKTGPVFFEAKYHYNNVMRTENQLILEKESFGGKIGFFTSSTLANGDSRFGFSVGFSQNELIKRVSIEDKNLFPYEYQGASSELNKIYIGYQTHVYSIGFKMISFSKDRSAKMDNFADEFDMKFLKNKNLSTVIKLDFDVLFASKIEHDSTILYSPYGFFIPKELQLRDGLVKKARMGVLMRMMYTPYTKIGFSAEFGLIPGLKFKNGNENGVNLTAKFGVHLNFNYLSSKQKK